MPFGLLASSEREKRTGPHWKIMINEFNEPATGRTRSAAAKFMWLGFALTVVFALVRPIIASGATLSVLNTLDKGSGSLRDAVNNAKDGDKIVFDSKLAGQTITLTSDELRIKESLDIEGPGADLLTISGNDTIRVFDILEGSTVRIAGLTIMHGLAQVGGGNDHGAGGGGGILNAGNLTVVNAVLSANEGMTHGG